MSQVSVSVSDRNPFSSHFRLFTLGLCHTMNDTVDLSISSLYLFPWIVSIRRVFSTIRNGIDHGMIVLMVI